MEYLIKSDKQANGLYPIPETVISIENWGNIPYRDALIRSAILMALHEKHGRPMQVTQGNYLSLHVVIQGHKEKRFKYSNFTIYSNLLSWTEE